MSHLLRLLIALDSFSHIRMELVKVRLQPPSHQQFGWRQPGGGMGVMRYLNRNRASHVSNDPGSHFFVLSLNVCMARSANPFNARWYGADVTCRIPFCFVKSSVKTLPLLVTSISGNPWVVNIDLIFSIVDSDVAELTM